MGSIELWPGIAAADLWPGRRVHPRTWACLVDNEIARRAAKLQLLIKYGAILSACRLMAETLGLPMPTALPPQLPFHPWPTWKHGGKITSFQLPEERGFLESSRNSGKPSTSGTRRRTCPPSLRPCFPGTARNERLTVPVTGHTSESDSSEKDTDSD